MKPSIIRLAIGFCIGFALVTAATLVQPRFVAGSIPDEICELVLMPGKLLAVPFHDSGDASPEFLWRSRMFGSIILGIVVFLAMSPEEDAPKRYFRLGGDPTRMRDSAGNY